MQISSTAIFEIEPMQNPSLNKRNGNIAISIIVTRVHTGIEPKIGPLWNHFITIPRQFIQLRNHIINQFRIELFRTIRLYYLNIRSRSLDQRSESFPSFPILINWLISNMLNIDIQPSTTI